MKVIKASIDVAAWSIEKECSNCKSILEICCKDISYQAGEYKKELQWQAICCLCKHPIYIPVIDLPKLIQSDIIGSRYVVPSGGGRD